MNNKSVLGLAPAVQQPHASPAELAKVRERTVTGAIKAVIGSEQAFIETIKKTKPIPGKDKEGKPRTVEVSHQATYFRTVRSLHQYAGVEVQWVALGTDLRGDDEEEIKAKIFGVYGGPEAMKKKGLRIVYCAESLEPIEVPVSRNGELEMVTEIALLSDREVG